MSSLNAVCDHCDIGTKVSWVLGLSEVFMVNPKLFMREVLPGVALIIFLHVFALDPAGFI